jgi:hypothetical protein
MDKPQHLVFAAGLSNSLFKMSAWSGQKAPPTHPLCRFDFISLLEIFALNLNRLWARLSNETGLFVTLPAIWLSLFVRPQRSFCESGA